MRTVLIFCAACLLLAGSLAYYGPLGTAYGALCAVCFWLAWRDCEWRAAGMALAISWFISNLICVVGDPASRPPVYSATEILVLMSAVTCWFAGRSPNAARILGVVSFISIACNVIYASSPHTRADLYAFELRTNIAFALECFTVGTVGALDRGYIRYLFDRCSRRAASNVRVSKVND